MTADRTYLFGNKAQRIVQMASAGGAHGVDPEEICRLLKTTRRSIAQVLMRERQTGGANIVARRMHGGQTRYFLLCDAPVQPIKSAHYIPPGVHRAVEAVRAALAAAGPAGLLRPELDGLAGQNATEKACGLLHTAGELHRTNGNQLAPARLFGRAEWLNAWVLANAAPKPEPRKRGRKPGAVSKAKQGKPEPHARVPKQKASKAPAAKPGPTLVPLHVQKHGKAWRPPAPVEPRPVVIPANVKVTVLPSAPVFSRYQLQPGERVVGGFASLGPGRYLDGMA